MPDGLLARGLAALRWHWRRGITVFVGLPLLFVVLMISAALAGMVPMGVMFGLSEVYSPSIVWNLALVALLAVPAGVYAAVPATRFVLRVFPMHADGQRRWALLMALVLVGALAMGFLVWRQLHPIPRADTAPGPEARLTGIVVVAVQVVVLLSVLGRRDGGMRGPRVLFLRRFRSFSDRVVYRLVLAALPRGSHLTALVPLHGGARDLDPFTIAFAGMRWADPLASIPRTYDSDDATWPHHVRKMIVAADCIVVDGSADSASMRLEYDLIDELGLGPRTVVVVDAATTTTPPTFNGAATLRYQRYRWPSLPRALVWLALLTLYVVLAFKWPVEYPPLGVLCFLPMLPALLQRSVGRESLRALQTEIARRTASRPVASALAMFARQFGWGAALAAGVVGMALAARAWYAPLPADDPAAWHAVTRPMGEQEVAIGLRHVLVPVPAGFVEPKDMVISLRRLQEHFSSGEMRVALTLAPVSWVAQALFEDTAPRDPNLVVLVDDALEREMLDLPAFARQREQVRQDAAAAGRLELLAEGERHIMLGYDAWVPLGAGEPVVHKTCRMAIVLALGKVLNMTLCRNHLSERDAAWVSELTDRWVAELLSRNPATPPLAEDGFGMTVQVRHSFRYGATDRAEHAEGSLTVTEVVAGSAAARAPLRTGDKILAVDGASTTEDPGRFAITLNGLPRGGEVRLRLRRDNQELEVLLARP